MDGYVTRKRRRGTCSPDLDDDRRREAILTPQVITTQDAETTEIKLATLASLHSDFPQECLLEALLDADGKLENAIETLSRSKTKRSPQVTKTVGYQSTLPGSHGQVSHVKSLTQRGKTLYLYSPADVEKHTPCSIVHNFLPAEDAKELLLELLAEAPTFRRETFQLFDRTVESPHSMAFYVDSVQDVRAQRTEYVYNGSSIPDVRETLPCMRRAARVVQKTVNAEIQRRIKMFYINSEKLQYQSPKEWVPNASFVNCYSSKTEAVGYHADQLTYLGPRAVIGSLSLGVAREFRVRRIVPPQQQQQGKSSTADQQGQISIHLPHNSLLVMHAEMQEEWKHAIAGATSIDPHPVSGNKRLNITYRCYKESMHPRFTPKCKCGISTVLRCVQKREETRGRYMWMCHSSYTPGNTGCNFFVWADFDDDGEPPWARDRHI